MRSALHRVRVTPTQLIVPVFVKTFGATSEVPSMPGVFQHTVDDALRFLESCAASGIGMFIVFGVVERGRKDATGSPATDPDNVVCKLLREVKRRGLPMLAITDLCLCEYTDHGHCGPLKPDGVVDNDPTLDLLVQQAINHVRAGADVIAPSGMMDGTIASLRRGLDAQGLHDTVLMSYAVKYASGYYGPFRDAADSAPSFGDRRGYQMDPSRGVEEAVLEAQLDIDQGADIVMVKPAGPYLDIIRAVRERVTVPVAAYQVSGEYAMIEAAARNGWIDRERVVTESATSISRAGADLIITYHAPLLAKLLA
jgi:porphobilinogen synthase